MAEQAAVYWRFVLADLLGRPISLLSAIASGKRLDYPLNRPASVSFTVPSDHLVVNEIYTADGYADPALSVGNRVIKAYRRTSSESTWTLRGNYLIWDLQDQGDATTTQTAVTGYDVFQLLRRRLIRAVLGTVNDTVRFNGATDSSGSIEGMLGDQIVKAMVDRSITYGGAFGLSTAVADGASFQTAPRQNKAFDQAYIADGIIELCDTGLLDVWFQGLDRTDGTLWAMHAAPSRGTDRSSTVEISYAAAGRTAYQMDRSLSMETMANDIRLWGTSTTGPLAHINETGGFDGGGNPFPAETTPDPAIIAALATSIAKYYRYETADVESDIKTKTGAQLLAAEEAYLRNSPRNLLTVLPTPGIAPPPFASGGGFNYFLGDLVTVVLDGALSRESTSGIQRVYGISLDVDDDGVERVAGLDVSPQGAA